MEYTMYRKLILNLIYTLYIKKIDTEKKWQIISVTYVYLYYVPMPYSPQKKKTFTTFRKFK